MLVRSLVLLDGTGSLSWWSPLAWLWQDVVLVLACAAVERLAGPRRWLWILYALTAVYSALNLPLVRILSTPLTLPMARAAGAPLADSVTQYLTWGNGARVALVLAAAVWFPTLLRSCPSQKYSRRETALLWKALQSGFCLTAAVGLCLAGPRVSARLDKPGIDRNAVFTLIASMLPTLSPRQLEAAWSESPFGAVPGEDLASWRGSCAGRNVVLILLESTGAQYLHAYGATENPMPNLSALAGDAILFDNAYCVYPESIKGLFSVLTAQYPSFDSVPADYEHLPVPSLPRVLARHGYRTALYHSGRFRYLGMESIVRPRGYEALADAGDIGGNHQSSFGVDEPATVAQMLAWIDSVSGHPFFLTYLPIAGHHPYATPEPGPFPEPDELGRYRNALHYGDQALGTFLTGLRNRHLLEKTLLVLAGDHGEAFGQHAGNFGHTMFLYEENVRVPLLITAPGLVRAQTRVARLVSLIDLMPTVLDLLGLQLPGQVQGRSLLSADDQMALFYTDYASPLVGLRDQHWKFVYHLRTGRAELFDLASDPAERCNLSARHPGRVAVYRSHLLDWAAAQKSRIFQPRPRVPRQ